MTKARAGITVSNSDRKVAQLPRVKYTGARVSRGKVEPGSIESGYLGQSDSYHESPANGGCSNPHQCPASILDRLRFADDKARASVVRCTVLIYSQTPNPSTSFCSSPLTCQRTHRTDRASSGSGCAACSVSLTERHDALSRQSPAEAPHLLGAVVAAADGADRLGCQASLGADLGCKFINRKRLSVILGVADDHGDPGAGTTGSAMLTTSHSCYLLQTQIHIQKVPFQPGLYQRDNLVTLQQLCTRFLPSACPGLRRSRSTASPTN